MKRGLLIVALGLLLMAAPVAWFVVRGLAATQRPAAAFKPEELPWSARLAGDGFQRALGVELGRASLSSALEHTPQGATMALLERRDGWTVEAYAEVWPADYVQGRAVLIAPVTAAQASAWRTRARRDTRTASGATRWTLADGDRRQAEALIARELVFMPSARLADDVLRERFGAPTVEIAAAEGVRHWIYRERAIIISLAPGGQVVLRYLLPDDMAAAIDALSAADSSALALRRASAIVTA